MQLKSINQSISFLRTILSNSKILNKPIEARNGTLIGTSLYVTVGLGVMAKNE